MNSNPKNPGEPGARSGSGSRSALSHLDAERKAKEQSGGVRQPVARSNITVLVVDDLESARYAMARGLEHLGFRVIEAAAGAQALTLLDRAAAIVLDVPLPDLDGLEVCRLIRERPEGKRIPIIHVTAIYDGEEYRRQSKAVGADEYLVSPVDPQRVARLLDELLSSQ